MTELIIYQIIDEDIKDSVVNFCNGLFTQNQKATILFESIELMQEIDKKLWTFSSEKFIPHGTILDKFDKSIQSFHFTNMIEDIADYPNIAFVYSNDLHEQNFDSLNQIKFENFKKVAYIFSGIMDAKDYIYQIKNLSINSFDKVKYFQRINNFWLNVESDV